MVKNVFSVFGILVVLLMGIGMVSATTSGVLAVSSLSAPTTIAEDAGSFTFTFNVIYSGADEDANISFTDSIISSFGTVVIPDAIGMNGTAAETRTITGTVSNFADRGGQSLTVYVNATKGTSRDDETNFTVSITDVTAPSEYDFCEINGTIGDLKIANVEFTNLGEGEDTDWYLLDGVEVEVEVENTNRDEHVKDVIVEVMILDDRDNDVTGDFDFVDDKIDLNTIKDDESEYATFKISEVPADLEAGTYKVYVKAYSEGDEEIQCASESSDLDRDFYQRIDVTREDDPAVIVKNNALKISASCGDNNVQLPLDVYNLGSDKEDKVLVTLENSALGVAEKMVIDNLRSGKRKEVIFFFDVPAQLSKDIYNLEIKTYYDYDDDEDALDEFSYGENSDDDLSKGFSTRLEILSCKGPEPVISAGLESESIVGADLVVRALVTNNDDNDNFVISVSDYESWANLVSISPQVASIDRGESEEVLITFAPTVAGAHSFKINTAANGETYDQPVSVNVAEEPGLFSGVSDKMLYVVAGIVAVLILIFAVMILKIKRRSAHPKF